MPYAADPEVAPAGLQRWFVHHDRAGLLALLAEAGFEVLSDEVRVSHRTWLQVHAVAG